MLMERKEFKVLWEDPISHKAYEWTVEDFNEEAVRRRFGMCHAGAKVLSVAAA